MPIRPEADLTGFGSIPQHWFLTYDQVKMMLTDEVIIGTAFTLHNNNAFGVGHLGDNFCAPNNEKETKSIINQKCIA